MNTSIICIYQIRNVIDDKRYIGRSCDIEHRYDKTNKLDGYKYVLNEQRHHNPHLQNAWNKHGEKNFIFETIQECKSDIEAKCMEQWWFDYYILSNRWDILYNISKSSIGISSPFPEESKKRLSESKKSKKLSSAMKGKSTLILMKEKYGIEEAIKRYEITKQRIGSASKGHTQKPLLQTWIDKYGLEIAEEKWAIMKDNLRTKCSGENNQMYKKTFYEVWVGKYGYIEADRLLEQYKIDAKERAKKKYWKLTIEQANEIRELYKTEDYSQYELGSKYNVSAFTISCIVRNVRYVE